MLEPFGDAVRAGIVGGGDKAEIAELQATASAGSRAEAGIACSGSNGSSSPVSTAACGMNCAMPIAPFLLTSSSRSRLSCQIRLAKNGIGRSLSCADVKSALHRSSSETSARAIAVACRISRREAVRWAISESADASVT